eukprot:maker-scaffold_6-snap-gene-11.63-mRNA-1 protein AED:0.15 eAED:0.15 QI:154/1/1/1/0.5/0.33/3/946/76
MSGIIDLIPGTEEREQYKQALKKMRSKHTLNTRDCCRMVAQEVDQRFMDDCLAAGSTKEANIYLQEGGKGFCCFKG